MGKMSRRVNSKAHFFYTPDAPSVYAMRIATGEGFQRLAIMVLRSGRSNHPHRKIFTFENL